MLSRREEGVGRRLTGAAQHSAQLSGRYRCISCDPRGASDTSAPSRSLKDDAIDCAAVIDAFRVGQAVVSGPSLGGLVTQATA